MLPLRQPYHLLEQHLIKVNQGAEHVGHEEEDAGEDGEDFGDEREGHFLDLR